MSGKEDTTGSPAKQQHDTDLENASPHHQKPGPTSAFHQLGLLDRFLAVWIFLAMAVGIILGNFAPSTGPALQRGQFVGVSMPIGTIYLYLVPVNDQRRSEFNVS
jgi:ACR3 family arsenite transporter